MVFVGLRVEFPQCFETGFLGPRVARIVFHLYNPKPPKPLLIRFSWTLLDSSGQGFPVAVKRGVLSLGEAESSS